MSDVVLDVDVLFEGGGILAVDKPAGLATMGDARSGGDGEGSRERVSLLDAMRASFDVEPGFSGPSIFGRLDRPTSGIVLAALTRAAHRAVEPGWSAGAIHKDYLVVVHGRAPERGRIDIPLAARRARHKGSGRVEEALTTFVRRASSPRLSLLVARIHTGRTHQIRRHMKAIGHPVVGDPRYGHAARDAALAARKDEAGDHEGELQGLMLHAWRLSHDGTVPVVPALLEAPMPARIAALCRTFGLVIAETSCVD
jgi:23S rRNA pseudouridine955/2504/2580 synthase